MTSSQPHAAIGETIEIGPTRVTLAICGDFEYEVLSRTSTVDEPRGRSWSVSMRLHSGIAEPLCEVPAETSLRVQFEGSVGYNVDGGAGSFRIYKPGEQEPIIFALAENLARYDPCDAGTGSDTVSCAELRNAILYRNLAQQVYSAYLAATPGTSARPPRGSFDVARFAAATRDFCYRREVGDRYEHWPYVRALECQASYLQSKLTEFYALRKCVDGAKPKTPRACRFPSERFAR